MKCQGLNKHRQCRQRDANCRICRLGFCLFCLFFRHDDKAAGRIIQSSRAHDVKALPDRWICRRRRPRRIVGGCSEQQQRLLGSAVSPDQGWRRDRGRGRWSQVPVSGSSSATLCCRSEAFGPPGGGLGWHWGSKAGKVLRAAHVRSLEEEKQCGDVAKTLVCFPGMIMADNCKMWVKF